MGRNLRPADNQTGNLSAFCEGNKFLPDNKGLDMLPA